MACADTQHLASQTEATEHAQSGAAVSLAETGSLSTRTGLSLAPALLSIIKAPGGFSSSHSGRAWMSYVKHATQKPCFHYASIKYLQCFLILAWQFDKSALCEQAVAGMVT